MAAQGDCVRIVPIADNCTVHRHRSSLLKARASHEYVSNKGSVFVVVVYYHMLLLHFSKDCAADGKAMPDRSIDQHVRGCTNSEVTVICNCFVPNLCRYSQLRDCTKAADAERLA